MEKGDRPYIIETCYDRPLSPYHAPNPLPSPQHIRLRTLLRPIAQQQIQQQFLHLSHSNQFQIQCTAALEDA